MFLRVLGALVTADAIDRRMRNRQLRDAQTAALTRRLEGPPTALPVWRDPTVSRGSGGWDRTAPERPVT